MTVHLPLRSGAEFWSSPKAWVHRSGQRRLRERLIHISGEPEGKGTRGGRALPQFRRQVAEQLQAFGRGGLTGPLALDLAFVSTRKNPTAIHNMAKWTLDALGNAYSRPDAAAGQGRRLYRDDRQVKVLHVSLRQAWQGNFDGQRAIEPGTYVHAQPLRDVIEDLRVMGELPEQDDEHDDYGRVQTYDLDEGEPSQLQPADGAAARVAAFFAAWDSFRRLERTQQALLVSMDHFIDNAVTTAPYAIAGARRPGPPLTSHLTDQPQQRDADPWDSLLSSPMTLQLPSLPESRGGRTAFREALPCSIEAFRDQLPSLTPLVVPLKATLIVVPPKQGKDLDNLALEVLPVVHDVLRPHVEPWQQLPIFTYFVDLDLTLKAERERALKRLQSINSQSITTYQIIEIERMPHHPPSGLLRLALGLGEGLACATRSVWTRASDRLWRHFHGR